MAGDRKPLRDEVTHVSVPTLMLEGEGDPFGGAMHVLIHADTVQVRGRVRFPGRTISVFARLVEADDAVLDLSGADVAISFDPGAAVPALNGTADQPHGQDGLPGEHGHDGGSLSLFAERLTGQLTVLANGSAGGSGQRGGDGTQPLPGHDGNPGSFTRHWPNGAPDGPYGAKVIYADHSRFYSRAADDVFESWAGCEVARGQNGGDASPGGNAGHGGRAGDGGNGGDITLRCVMSPARPPQLQTRGAPAGKAGDTGTPGEPGVAGAGGQHRLYAYEKHDRGSVSDWERYADDPASQDMVRRHGLALRANPGASCDKKGTAAPPPEDAAAGADGQIDLSPIKAGELGTLWDSAYLESTRLWAEQDAMRGMEWIERALADGDASTWLTGQRFLVSAQLGYGWLETLTRNSQPERSRQAAEQLAALARFNRSHPFVPLAATPAARAA